tara:strand:+ start:192 stop:734 length:543 start_codon:yes stop_codon:yes gene_type:complete
MSTLELKELSHPSGEVIKIAAGKTLDLNSQGTLVLPTIPHAKMPSGSVLQVVNAYSVGQVSSTSTSRISLDTLVVTPLGTGSKFAITFFLQANWSSYNAGFGAYMYKDGTEIAASGNHHSVYTNTLTDAYLGGSWSFVNTGSTAGTAISFELRAQAHSTNGVYYSAASQSRGFVIMEIAQ